MKLFFGLLAVINAEFSVDCYVDSSDVYGIQSGTKVTDRT